MNSIQQRKINRPLTFLCKAEQNTYESFKTNITFIRMKYTVVVILLRLTHFAFDVYLSFVTNVAISPRHKMKEN